MKTFPSSGYAQLIDYWVSMGIRSPAARCSPVKLMTTNEKKTRLSCSYLSLTSYTTIVAKRFQNKYNERLIIMSGDTYSVTTAKQLRNLSWHKSEGIKIISGKIPTTSVLTESYAKEALDRLLQSMVYHMQKFERARSDNGRFFAEREFLRAKEEAITLMNFVRAERRTNNFNSKLIKDLSIFNLSSIIIKKIEKQHKKELAKIRLSRNIENSEVVSSDKSFAITKGGDKIDLFMVGVSTNMINMKKDVRDSMLKTFGKIRIVNLRGKEFYKVKDSIVCKRSIDSLVTEMLPRSPVVDFSSGPKKIKEKHEHS